MIRHSTFLFACCLLLAPLAVAGFAPQTRVGFTTGDQWEPAIAADGYGHVYILYPQYGGVPGCPTCPSPTAILTISSDRGATSADTTHEIANEVLAQRINGCYYLPHC